jgi:hypothetical protein
MFNSAGSSETTWSLKTFSSQINSIQGSYKANNFRILQVTIELGAIFSEKLHQGLRITNDIQCISQSSQHQTTKKDNLTAAEKPLTKYSATATTITSISRYEHPSFK